MKIWAANHKILGSHSMFQPLNYRDWFGLANLFFKQMLLNELTQAKLVSWWYVPQIVHVTIWKFGPKIEISERTDQFETNISI